MGGGLLRAGVAIAVAANQQGADRPKGDTCAKAGAISANTNTCSGTKP